MTDHEFSLMVNLYKSMNPGVTSKTVNAVTRNFKDLCTAWKVDVNTERMSRVPNLLVNAQNGSSPYANTPRSNGHASDGGGAATPSATAPAAADNGGAFQDSGGPVAQ